MLNQKALNRFETVIALQHAIHTLKLTLGAASTTQTEKLCLAVAIKFIESYQLDELYAAQTELTNAQEQKVSELSKQDSRMETQVQSHSGVSMAGESQVPAVQEKETANAATP